MYYKSEKPFFVTENTINKIKIFFFERAIIILLILFIIFSLVGSFYNFSIREAVGDENQITNATLRMIANHDLRPNYPTFLYYPIMVYFYLPFFVLLLLFLRFSGLFSMSELVEFGHLNYAMLLPMARFISVLFGAGAIYLIYKIAQVIFKKKSISLIAAYLLATSLMFFQNAHFGKVWVPQIFFILLAFYFIVNFYLKEKIKLKDYFICAFFIGLSFSTHGVGIFVGAAFLMAVYLKNEKKKLFSVFFKNKKFILSCFIIVGFYFLTYFLNPYGFNNNNKNLNSVYDSYINRSDETMQIETVYGYTCGENYFDRANYYNQVLFEYEPFLLAVFIPAAIFLLIKKRKYFFLLISTPLVYYLFITFLSVFWSRGCVPRYILPVIPFMALMSAFGIYSFYKTDIFNKKIKLIFLIIFFLCFLYLPAIWDQAIIKPSTRLEAKKWINNNIPEESKIIAINGYVVLIPNKQAIFDTKEYNKNFVNQKYDYLLSKDEVSYPHPNYYFMESRYFKNIPDNKKPGIDYIIVGWWNQKEREKVFSAIKELGGGNLRVVKKFPNNATMDSEQFDIVDFMKRPFYVLKQIKYTGPVIFIYRLNS